MFSSSSYAEWTKVGENDLGTYYVDFERIRKQDGYVYWWSLWDFPKPQLQGIWSAKTYNQGDCKVFRFKRLSYIAYEEPMGPDAGKSNNPENPEWIYPPPLSVDENFLKSGCNR
jgi:hypothetical protein